MKLNSMKASIIRRARAWEGTFDSWDMVKGGDRYGRLSQAQQAYNGRLFAALAELVAEGRLVREGTGTRSWVLKG